MSLLITTLPSISLLYKYSLTSSIDTIAPVLNPYTSLTSSSADLLLSPDNPTSHLLSDTISPTIVTSPCALTIGTVSSIDFPDVVTSSIMTPLSPSLILYPRSEPISAPWSFSSFLLELYLISFPYSLEYASAVTTESGIPLYAGPNNTSKSSPYVS